MKQLTIVGALTALWLALQGEATLSNALAGLAVAAVVVAVASPPTVAQHRLRPLPAVRLAGLVAWSLVTSSAQVARTSLAPTDRRLRAGIVRIELPGATPLVTTIVANLISVTPGTLTVDATPDGVLHVHALGLDDPDELRATVAALHRHTTAALPRIGGPS